MKQGPSWLAIPAVVMVILLAIVFWTTLAIRDKTIERDRLAKIQACEDIAVQTLGRIVKTENAYRAACITDEDGDGIGEYVSLDRLRNPSAKSILGDERSLKDTDLRQEGYGFIVALRGDTCGKENLSDLSHASSADFNEEDFFAFATPKGGDFQKLFYARSDGKIHTIGPGEAEGFAAILKQWLDGQGE